MSLKNERQFTANWKCLWAFSAKLHTWRLAKSKNDSVFWGEMVYIDVLAINAGVRSDLGGEDQYILVLNCVKRNLNPVNMAGAIVFCFIGAKIKTRVQFFVFFFLFFRYCLYLNFVLSVAPWEAEKISIKVDFYRENNTKMLKYPSKSFLFVSWEYEISRLGSLSLALIWNEEIIAKNGDRIRKKKRGKKEKINWAGTYKMLIKLGK